MTPTETLPEWKRLQQRSFTLRDICDQTRLDDRAEFAFNEAYDELLWTEERLEELYQDEYDREEREEMEAEANS